jgi:hypothetical protein
MIESQLALVLGAIRHMREHGFATVQPRPEEQARFVAEVNAAMRGTVWTDGGCASWYIDKTGRNSTLWPSSTASFRRRCRFRPAEYLLGPAVAPTQSEESAAVHAPGPVSSSI